MIFPSVFRSSGFSCDFNSFYGCHSPRSVFDDAFHASFDRFKVFRIYIQLLLLFVYFEKLATHPLVVPIIAFAFTLAFSLTFIRAATLTVTFALAFAFTSAFAFGLPRLLAFAILTFSFTLTLALPHSLRHFFYEFLLGFYDIR